MQKKVNISFSNFLNYGITPELSVIQSQKILTFNLFVIIALPLQILFAFYYLFFGDALIAVGNFIQMAIFLFGYFTIDWPKGMAIRKWIIFLSSILTIYCGIVNNNGNEMMLLPLIIFALIIYDTTIFFIIHTLISLFAILFIRVQLLHLYSYLQNINFSISIIYLTTVLVVLKNIYLARQNLLGKKIESVQKQNKALKEIAWIQSHVVRAPIARMMSAISALGLKKNKMETDDIFNIVNNSAKELDVIVKDIVQKAHENHLDDDFVI